MLIKEWKYNLSIEWYCSDILYKWNMMIWKLISKHDKTLKTIGVNRRYRWSCSLCTFRWLLVTGYGLLLTFCIYQPRIKDSTNYAHRCQLHRTQFATFYLLMQQQNFFKTIYELCPCLPPNVRINCCCKKWNAKNKIVSTSALCSNANIKWYNIVHYS